LYFVRDKESCRCLCAFSCAVPFVTLRPSNSFNLLLGGAAGLASAACHSCSGRHESVRKVPTWHGARAERAYRHRTLTGGRLDHQVIDSLRQYRLGWFLDRTADAVQTRSACAGRALPERCSIQDSELVASSVASAIAPWHRLL
jgi:hypothetical protein